MSNSKLTDSEILKALECCGHNSIAGWLNDCKNCPLKDNTKCIPEIICKALDLINRLQAENKSQSIMIKMLNGSIEDYKNSYIKQQAEIERLKAEVKFSDYLEYEAINQTKAEAYKECIEKVKEYIDTHEHLSCEECECVPISKDGLDNLLKELVGEKNA